MYKNNLSKRKSNQCAILISFMILFSFPPWPVWWLGVWNMRIISLITLLIALNILTLKSAKQNFFLALLYLISILYMSFGGLDGYVLPTHIQFTMFVLILTLSSDFLIDILDRFEKLITIVFVFGIIVYAINLILKLPSFNIKPLNTLKDATYSVYVFNIQLNRSSLGKNQFMSVFDEPGVVGTLIALLISYRELKFNKVKDVVLLISGLISFSLAFYIILVANLLYSKKLNLKYLLLIFVLLSGFYLVNPNFINRVLFKRFIVGNSIGIVDDRSSQEFNDAYDGFIKNGGDALLFGLGPNSLHKLSKDIVLNVSSYKTVIYQFGILGTLLFISFFFYATLKFAPVKRGWFFFIVFLALAWQRPGVFSYFNLLIYLGGLSYISATVKKRVINYQNYIK